MRLLLLKVCAVVIALGVVAFVVQASRTRARASAEPAAPPPVASASATAGDPAPPPPANYGIIGPATKADPHVMRRAAESLGGGALGAPAPTSPSPAPAPGKR